MRRKTKSFAHGSTENPKWSLPISAPWPNKSAIASPQLGARSLSDLTGWYDRLSARSGMDPLLIVPMSESGRVAPHQSPALHAAAREDALKLSAAFELQTESQPIQNSDRSVGAGMSGELMRRRRPGSEHRPHTEEITKEFHGCAGQSFRRIPRRGNHLVALR